MGAGPMGAGPMGTGPIGTGYYIDSHNQLDKFHWNY